MKKLFFFSFFAKFFVLCLLPAHPPAPHQKSVLGIWKFSREANNFHFLSFAASAFIPSFITYSQSDIGCLEVLGDLNPCIMHFSLSHLTQ